MSFTSSPNFTDGSLPVLDSTTCGLRGDVNAVAVGSIATVLTPSSGKKLRILGMYIGVSAACSVLFEDNSAGTANFVFRTPPMATNTGMYFSLGNGKLLSAVDNVLKATSSAAANLTGTIFYSEEV